MAESANWDWNTKEKLIADVGDWKKKFSEVHELVVSSDGEKIATVVQTEDGGFATCVNGEVGGDTFERIWSLRFTPTNQLVCLVMQDFEWTVAVDNDLWEEKFEFIWNMQLTPDGKGIAVNVKKDEQHAACLNGKTWDNMFTEARDLVVSPDGKKTASAVAIKSLPEGDIFGFQEGVWSAAIDGIPWDKSFVNVWGLTFSPDSKHLAAEVRLSLYDYTIAVDGKAWGEVFGCVWEPVFAPRSSDIIAPAKTPAGWTLVMNGKPIWGKFVQVLYPKFSPDGQRVAAVVAPDFGKWTVAVDGSPWGRTFSDAVWPPVFSPDGRRVAAIVKESKQPMHMQSALHNIPGNDRWTIVVDGTPWQEDFDMIWEPVFSPGGDTVAAKAERNGKYCIVVNGRPGKQWFEALWDPVFSPNGEKILIRCVENGKYYRRVVPVGEV